MDLEISETTTNIKEAIKELDLNIDKSYRPDLFDYSAGYDSEPDVKINDKLSSWIIEEGIKYYNLFSTPPTGLCGVTVLSGNVGNGKDLTGNYLSWVINNVFPNKRLLRDEKPRELFGLYDGLFNEEVLHEDLNKMRELTKSSKMTLTERNALLDQAADDWVSSTGQVMLKNSVLYLTEFWRYLNLREPFNPMNKTMGGVHRVKRHLDLLVIGTIQLITDLDKRNALPFIDWRIMCRRSSNNPTGFMGYVYKFQYNMNRQRIEMSSSPIEIIKVDGAKPITELGESITILDDAYKGNKYDQKVIDAIESGIVTFEDLKNEVKFSKNSDISVLKILKNLFVNKVVTYGCFFKVYNSKSATDIN